MGRSCDAEGPGGSSLGWKGALCRGGNRLLPAFGRQGNRTMTAPENMTVPNADTQERYLTYEMSSFGGWICHEALSAD